MRPFIPFLLFFAPVYFVNAQTQIHPKGETFYPYNAFIDHIKQPGDSLVVVYIWATWCGPCVESIPKLNAIRESNAGKKMSFYMVSVDKTEAPWKKLLEKTETGWNQVWVSPENKKEFQELLYKESSVPCIYSVQQNKKPKRIKGASKLSIYLAKI